MNLESMIELAVNNGASDLHLESGLPAALRVRGALRTVGDPIAPKALLDAAQTLLGDHLWPSFLERRSCDLSRTIHGTRCRINVLQTSRGIGFAIRLLATFQATIEKLNLLPDLKKFAAYTNGLILVSGPTGSGKSSTLAALIQEINLQDSRHIVTVESPIEYLFRPRRAYIRQREVGRDTPSFEQALLDALREDPDVLMVGEMREPETMRLTLNASETGHLVLATVHSSNGAEALQRVVSAFPAEIQSNVAAQLADCLLAVVTQRLQYRPDLNIRLPECEILMATHAIRNFVRNRDFFKIASALETGAEHGMWTFARYRAWMETRKNWFIPGQSAEPPDTEAVEPGAGAELPPPTPGSGRKPDATPAHKPQSWASQWNAPRPGNPAAPASSPAKPPGRIEIEPGESEFGKILKRPGE